MKITDNIQKKLTFYLEKFTFYFQNIYFTISPFKIHEFKELIKGLSISKEDIILDLGCGNGIETLILGKGCKKIYGIDVLKEDLIKAKLRSHYMKKKINSEFRLTKIEYAGFQSDFFDKIFSICVLEHINNYIEVLKECYRILKKGGQMIFSVDSLGTINDEKIISLHKKKYYVENYFDKDQLYDGLRNIGFKNIIIHPIFKSNYSKKLFIEGVKKDFKFGLLFSLLKYYRLKIKEARASANKGLILIVKCLK